MAKEKADKDGRTYTIEKPMDESERLTIREPTTGATYEISEIADETARDYVMELDSGSTVRLELAGAETPTIEGVLPVSMPDSYGSDYTVENCGM